MSVRPRLVLLLLLQLFAACGSGQAPYATTVGILHAGDTITIRISHGTVNAYAPAIGEPRNRFTIAATADSSTAQPSAPTIRPVHDGITVIAPALRSLLVRVPQGVDLTVISSGGDINVTDISGDVRILARSGATTVMVPGSVQASMSQAGTLSIIMGSTQWPGTLHFSNANGDVSLSINENARFHARLHTDNGTVFTDFNLRGSAQGTSETIDAPVNGAPRGASGVDVEVHNGSIRLLRLAPQM